MSIPVDINGVAPAAIEGMVYSLMYGTILALLIWLALRLLPGKNSGTQFAVWFSTLLAVTFLPFLGLPALTSLRAGAASSAAGAGHGLFMLPASWAVYGFLAWAVIATANLARVAVGFWQVHRLRQSCVPLDLKSLKPEVQEIVKQQTSKSSHYSRPVAIGTSDRLEVPTAVGFLRPAILLPAWLIAEVSATELKHILLHELAHLQRRDDWTNLAQKLVKAVMFFHPMVWWIERRLSLEREVACDDAVLVQTESPRIYAQCLARVAEKSFLRRQIALAQAAVSRMHHLSLRVAQILDLDRPRTTQLWKPAIPLVGLFAVLCGVSMRQAPMLVGFADHRPSIPTATATTTGTARAIPPGTRSSVTSDGPAVAVSTKAQGVGTKGMGPQKIDARFKLKREPLHAVPARVVAPRQWPRTLVRRADAAAPAAIMLAGYSGYVVAQEEFVVTMTNQGSAPGHWQVQVWQLRVLVPATRETVALRKT